MAASGEDHGATAGGARVRVWGPSHDSAQEDAWIAAVRTGDAEALSALFTAYYAELRAYATSIVADHQAAELARALRAIGLAVRAFEDERGARPDGGASARTHPSKKIS